VSGIMPTPVSKLTSQGQVSVPSEVRKRLGLGPGSALEWHAADGAYVVRRAGRVGTEQIRAALFDAPPEPRTLDELREGLREHVRRKHARG
jgi:AbrB family looped-hinge helix DNA binding protein